MVALLPFVGSRRHGAHFPVSRKISLGLLSKRTESGILRRVRVT
jgi:hypothetical protein